MSDIAQVIRHFPGDLQDPMIQFWEVVKDELGVKREDFTELKNIVGELAEAHKELAEAQKRTEYRVGELAEAQKELTEAQKRTEYRVEELTEAQKRTEGYLQDLAISQRELAVAQEHCADTLHDFSHTFDFRLGGLECRWGINSERAFRSGLREVLSEAGYTVYNFIETDTEKMVFSDPAKVEIDIIIEGDRTIVIEIKSSVSKSDVYTFIKKAEFYTYISGKKVDRLLMITPYIDDSARVVADKHQIVICDSILDIRTKVQQS
jgi:hypothetical protein